MVRLKNKDESIREATAQFRLVAWATGSAIWDWDLESGEFWSSPGHQRLFGRGEDELVEHYDIEEEDNPWAAHHHPDDRKRVIQSVRDHLEHDTPYDVEYRYRLPSGAYIWIHSAGRAVRAADGRPIRMVGTNSDITARKEAEAVLREREARHASIADLSQDLIWIFTDGVIVDCNDYAAHALGLKSQEELVGTAILALLHPDDHEMARHRFAQLLEEGVSTPSREIRLLRSDGTYVFVETKACPYTYKGKPSVLALARDITERRQSERALLESEERLAEAQRIAHIGHWVHYYEADHFTGDRLFWSDETRRIFGLDSEKDEVSVASFLRLVHPDDLGLVTAESEGAVTGGETYAMEYRIVLPGGEVRHIHDRGEIIRDEAGKPLRSFGTAQDITERMRGEQELRESETLHRNILDNMVDTFYRADGEGKIVMASPSVKELLGYSVEEILGQRLGDLYADPEGRDAFLQAFAESGGDIHGYEAALRRKDGRIVWVSTNSRTWLDANGNVQGIEGTARDITERKQVELAYQESEGRFRGIIENSPAAISLKDLEGRFQLVNSRFAEWYGISAAEMIGRTSYGVLSRELADLFIAQDQEVIASETTTDRERDIPFADGTIHHIIVTKFPVRDGTGKVVGIGTINTDVTAQREAQGRLRQSQKMEAVGQLTGGIAHDFNNLLAVIMGNLELIGDHVEGDGAVNEIIERGLKASERGATLTQRLLSFSRKQALSPTPIDLNKLISGMMDLLSRSLGEMIEIHSEGPPDLWQCRADQSQLENAILNLSINSRDAMPDGGVLKITTANVVLEDDTAATQLELTPGRYVMLSVSDTGTGIAEDALKHVFEPFFTTKDVGKGSGLGLSMVYGFAKQSNGAVRIDSEIATGTMIKIYLPALAGEASEAADAC